MTGCRKKGRITWAVTMILLFGFVWTFALHAEAAGSVSGTGASVSGAGASVSGAGASVSCPFVGDPSGSVSSGSVSAGAGSVTLSV